MSKKSVIHVPVRAGMKNHSSQDGVRKKKKEKKEKGK